MSRRRLGDTQPFLYAGQLILYIESFALTWMWFFAPEAYAAVWPVTDAVIDNLLLLMIAFGCSRNCPKQRLCTMLIIPEIIFHIAAWANSEGMIYLVSAPHYMWEFIDFLWTGLLIVALYTEVAANPRKEHDNEQARPEAQATLGRWRRRRNPEDASASATSPA